MGFTIININRECNAGNSLVGVILVDMLYKGLNSLVTRKKRNIVIRKKFVVTYFKII